MEEAKRILPRLMRQGQMPFLKELDLIRAFWTETVGPLLAEHSEPVRFEAPRLVVEVRGDAWLGQLRAMDDQIAGFLRAELPGTDVSEIKFVPAKSGADASRK